MDPIIDLGRKYENRKWLSITRLDFSLRSHGDNNAISRNVHTLSDFFKELNQSGTLENTLVIFAGDHGNIVDEYVRNQIGALESRLTMAYVIVPPWFKIKYREEFDNLKFNGRNKLTSHYDLYKTLKAVLSKEYMSPPEVADVDPQNPGVSLFQRIPEWRGCTEAGIPAQFCLCESYSPVETTDLRVIKGVQTLVQTLNDKLKVTGDLCIRYEEFSVNASRIRSSGDMLQITVNLHPYPFPANFLAFVQLTRTGIEVTGFERLDIYKKMSVCLDKMDEKDLLESKFLAMSCVCKDILRTQ